MAAGNMKGYMPQSCVQWHSNQDNSGCNLSLCTTHTQYLLYVTHTEAY